ncbi:MAG: hypothetical protein DPW11_00205 [bacterium]|nr:hypothetical protein [Candidatus Microgenomates bacterium CPR3]MCQ3944192.1 hypothetical protein [bacterium]RIK51971.1 MAG: hypothetical protein DCC61_01110 [Candidatus Microgenomates bacterium]
MITDTNSIYDSLSPRYMVGLINQIEETLWRVFEKSKYKNVRHYINKWHRHEENYNDYWENFRIFYTDEEKKQIDLGETLHNMPNEIIIRIATDLGIDTPGFLPVVTTFRNVLNDKNSNAHESFSRAIMNVYENPHDSISLANSTLEAIIKTLLEGNLISSVDFNPKDTLYQQTSAILKKLSMFPTKSDKYQEIIKIGSSLLTISQNIETLRSTKTDAHGRMPKDLVLSDSIGAVFIVNSVATVGVFLANLFEVKYPDKVESNQVNDINIEDIPF